MIFDRPKKNIKDTMLNKWKKTVSQGNTSIFQNKKNPVFLQEKFHEMASHAIWQSRGPLVALGSDEAELPKSQQESLNKNRFKSMPTYVYLWYWLYLYIQKNVFSFYSYHFLSAHLHWSFFCFQMPLGKAMLHWSSMAVAEEAAVVTPVLRTFGKGKDVDKASQRK